MNKFLFNISILVFIISWLSACSGSDTGVATEETNNAPVQYSIGVNVSGLESDGLVLQNNGGDNLAITGDGLHVFATALNDSAGYIVSIISQPEKPLHICEISNNSGTVANSDVTDILVNCSNQDFPVLFDAGVTYANQIYVATGGDDIAGDGTALNPYATIEKAASVAMPGTRINIATGTYNDTSVISGLQGTDKQPIAIVGSGGVTMSNAAGSGMHFIKPRYVVLDNLTIQGSANGVNIDDGGEVDNPDAAAYFIIKNSVISSTGGDNNDAIKASGVNNLTIVNNTLTGAGNGSGIDFVGCHDSVISGNTISGGMLSGIQTKGGSSDIIIHGNTIENITTAGARAINAGGSTGTAFFRPPLVSKLTDPSAVNYEAARIIMLANIINSVDSAIAYTGCVDCVFANNTIIDPAVWIVRILQETVTDMTYTFAEAQNGEYLNNIIRYSTADITSALRVVNIGLNTQPGTFDFNHNLWWAYNETAGYITTLPAQITAETNSLYQLDPLFSTIPTDLHISATSPVIGQGTDDVSGTIGRDFDDNPFTSPPAIGAFEGP